MPAPKAWPLICAAGRVKDAARAERGSCVAHGGDGRDGELQRADEAGHAEDDALQLVDLARRLQADLLAVGAGRVDAVGEELRRLAHGEQRRGQIARLVLQVPLERVEGLHDRLVEGQDPAVLGVGVGRQGQDVDAGLHAREVDLLRRAAQGQSGARAGCRSRAGSQAEQSRQGGAAGEHGAEQWLSRAARKSGSLTHPSVQPSSILSPYIDILLGRALLHSEGPGSRLPRLRCSPAGSSSIL